MLRTIFFYQNEPEYFRSSKPSSFRAEASPKKRYRGAKFEVTFLLGLWDFLEF